VGGLDDETGPFRTESLAQRRRLKIIEAGVCENIHLVVSKVHS
jgi:hypothetical protein